MEQFGTFIAKMSGMLERDSERRDWVSEQLSANNLDAFVCATPANILMLSGYWPVIGRSIAIATRDDGLYVLAPDDEEQLASRHGAELATYSSSLKQVKSLRESIADPIAKALASLGLSKARIGIETGPLLIPAAYVSVHVFGAELSSIITDAADKATLIPGDSTLGYLRSRLTQREVAKLRTACEIAEIAYEKGKKCIQEDATEAEVAAAFRRHLSINAGYKGAQRVDGSVWCMSGPNSAHAYASFQRSTDRKLQQGDLVLVHCNSYADGYWTDITRTYTLGTADEHCNKMLAAIAEARTCAIPAVHAGVRAVDIDTAARDVMTAYGYGEAFRHGTGHGVGFAAIDHDAVPRLSPNSPDVIEEGMAFNIEPGAYIEGFGGARHCDMVLCTANGAELLTDF